MKYKAYFLKSVAGFLLVSPQYVMADYRYTFTSGPITEIIANNNIRGNELVPIEPDDFLTIVINTTAAPMTQGADYPSGSNPKGYFLEATSIEMSFGAYHLNSADAGYNPYTSFFINEYDASGLPTNWNFNLVTEPYGSAGSTPDYFEQLQFLSQGDGGNSYNSIFTYSLTPAGEYYMNAIAAGPGQWTLEQISSPVPEVETYAMMMAGLGLVGFVSRRRKTKQ